MPQRRTRDLHRHRWSAASARYFITCCTQGRHQGLLESETLETLHRLVTASDQNGDSLTLAFTVMPDHVHWLLQLGSRLSLGRVVARFKYQTLSLLRTREVAWQRDFYEHRLRVEEDVEAYALYIFLNPYRAKLIKDGTWCGWMSFAPSPLQFALGLNPDGSPPKEWLDQPTDDPLHVGKLM